MLPHTHRSETKAEAIFRALVTTIFGTKLPITNRGRYHAIFIHSSLRKHPLGTFRAEERLRLRGRNSILMTQINVYIF